MNSISGSVLKRFCRYFFPRGQLIVLAVLTGIATLSPFCRQSVAQGLVDAEISDVIHTYAEPLMVTAGLDPNAVKIYIRNNDELNAFVSGGQNLFINTGLIVRADNAGQIIGVLAHEFGHMAGGHFSRTIASLENTGTNSLIAGILGVAAGIATGNGALGGAIISAGQGVSERGFLKYSRNQESSADQAAMRYLEANGFSAVGMMELMQKLEGQELLPTSRQNEYVRSHPLSRDRVISVENFLHQSKYTNAPLPDGWELRFQRIKAKIIGFMESRQRTYRAYPETNDSLPARYARAIADYRRNDLGQALPKIDALITEHPDDPYFHELKGQMLMEHGQIDEAVMSLRVAAKLAPGAVPIRSMLAQSLVETNDAANLSEAVDHLRNIVSRDPRNGAAWRLLAISFSRLGDEGGSRLASAELALLQGDKQAAKVHADAATKIYEKGSSGWLRAQDIKNVTELD
jgi:predicted Zn-dependent protease